MPRKLINLAGKRFGRLVVVSQLSRNYSGEITWFCQCDCGTETVVAGLHLRSQHTRSCGCLHRESIAEIGGKQRGLASPNYKHGCSRKSGSYLCWQQMGQRCTNPKAPVWKKYGAVGVNICDRWRGEHGFEHFVADIGNRPSLKHSVSRHLDTGDYEPSNCEWATWPQQASEAKGKRAMLAYRKARDNGFVWTEGTAAIAA